MGETTVGIDIGTSSVKAVAADADGNVINRARVPHDFHVPSALRFEHDAAVAWHDGPRRALAALGDIRPAAVSVAAMVPSLTAVDDDGVPCAPGLLYGDERGHRADAAAPDDSDAGQSEVGELAAFLRWHAAHDPAARGYWMAQAVANHALTGRPVISTTVALSAAPLFDMVGWDEGAVHAAGARVDQMPEVGPSGQAIAEVAGYEGCVLEGGTIDAMAEQLVAGADQVGDVLAILGTTLIVWAVVPDLYDSAPFYCVPHTSPGGLWLAGGPSNAGGLFLDWASRVVGARDGQVPGADSIDPRNVPVWVPYPRGERVPINDPSRRAELVDLDLTHDAAAIRRAAFEASGFVTRRIIEASPVPARRIVATGGGTRVAGWVDALADTTGLPVHVAAVTEGGALGAAFLARMAAGLETSTVDAARWARSGRTVEPDPRWAPAASERYVRFCEVAGPRAAGSSVPLRATGTGPLASLTRQPDEAT
jgi:xylulokinase